MAPSVASRHASARFSTYSMAPTMRTNYTTDSVQQEINDITDGLDKLENKKLASQRFVPTPNKSDTLSKLALGAKVERALDRRMGGQDAIMRTKKKNVTVESEKIMA